MKSLLMSGAFLLAALVAAPTARAQDAPAKDEKKATDKAPDAAKAVVYELTIDGLH